MKNVNGCQTWHYECTIQPNINELKNYLQINESVKNELDELKYEFQLMQGSLSELKNDKKQTIDAINNKLNRKRILYYKVRRYFRTT